MSENLVGDVKTETRDSRRAQEFMAKIEDLMVEYEISHINLGWKFGTPFNELKKALADDTPAENSKISIAEVEPEVRPRNSVIGTDSQKANPPKSGGFKKVGNLAAQAHGIDFDEEALAESQQEGGPRTALDVLDGVVNAMDKEQADLTPSLEPDPED